MKISDIDNRFSISEATGSSKATAIRKLIKIHVFDPEWTLSSRMEQNPIAWLIEIDGLALDARRLPREFQEEAYSLGLIPFVPEGRPNVPDEETP